MQQFYQLNASEVTTIGQKKELLQLAGETGLIDEPIKNELDEVQELRVKLAKYDLRLNMASETAEAKTNCTICEEIVSFRALILHCGCKLYFLSWYLRLTMVLVR